MRVVGGAGYPVAGIAEIGFTSEDRVREVINNFNRDGFSSCNPVCGGRPLEPRSVRVTLTGPKTLADRISVGRYEERKPPIWSLVHAPTPGYRIMFVDEFGPPPVNPSRGEGGLRRPIPGYGKPTTRTSTSRLLARLLRSGYRPALRCGSPPAHASQTFSLRRVD